MKPPKIRTWAIALLVTAFAVLMLTPFLWMVSTSLRLPKDSYKLPPSFLPTSFHFSSYISVLSGSVPILKMYLNSIIVTAAIVAGQLVTCSLAAYAFARLRFPGREALFIILLSGMMIPIQVTIIPMYILFIKFGFTNTLYPLIVPMLVSCFGIFLVRQFFLTIPYDFEESAKLEGAGVFATFIRIILPMSGSILSALAIISGTWAWQMYFEPLIYIGDWKKMTLTVGLVSFQGYMGSGNLSTVMAGVSLAVLPVILMFLFAQRYVIEGLTMTGLKG